MNEPKIILLDRDGVINQDSPNYILSPAAWIPLPGSIEAIASLCRAGYDIHIVTNQSAIARRLMSLETLSQIHHKMTRLVMEAGGKLASIQFCPHHPADNCGCRKPATGMLKSISQLTGESLAGCWMLGDKLSDVETAINYGCQPGLIMPRPHPDILELGQHQVNVFEDLAEFSASLLK